MEIKRLPSKSSEAGKVVLPSLSESLIDQTATSCMAIPDICSEYARKIDDARDKYHQRNYDEAKQLLEQIIPQLVSLPQKTCTSNPKNLSVLFLQAAAQTLQGLIHEELGQNLEASAAFRQAAELFDQEWESGQETATSQNYSDYGISLHMVAQTDKAIATLQKAVGEGISTPEIYRHLGSALQTKGNLKEALALVEKGLKQSPNDLLSRQLFAEILELLERWDEATDAYYETAILLVRDNRLDEAIALLNHAQTLSANPINVLSLKAEVLCSLNFYEEAVITLEQALTLDPQNLCFLASLGAILIEINRYEEALQNLEQVLALDPNNSFVLVNKARALSYLEHQHEAIEILKRVIEIDPNSARAYAELGENLRQIEQYEEALIALDRALEIEPDNILSLNSKSMILSVKQQYEESLKLLEQVLKLNPNDYFAIGIKVQILNAYKRDKEALKLLDNFLKQHPQEAYFLGLKGMILRDKERYDEAIQVLQEALKINPNIDWIYAELGNTWREMGCYQEALDALDKALVFTSDDINVLGNKSACLIELDRSSEALPLLEMVLKKNPDDAFCLAYKGIALKKLGFHDEALKTLELAFDRDSNLVWIAVTLGETLLEINHELEAIKVLDKALKLQPEEIAILELKVEALVRLGNYQEAVQHLKSIKHQSASAYTKLAQLLNCLGRYEESTKALHQARRLEAENPGVLAIYAKIFNAFGKYRVALRVLIRSQKLSSQLTWIETERGKILHMMGSYEEAINVLNTILQQQPDNFVVLGFKGGALRRLGNYEDALENLQKAAQFIKQFSVPQQSVELSFECAWILAEFGKTLQRLGRREQALQVYEQVLIRLDHSVKFIDENAHFMYKRVLGKKGQILRLLAQYEQAIKILQSIVNIPPDRVCQTWIHVELGESLRLAGRYKEARQELDRALKQDPNNVQALGSKGGTLAGLDLYPQALQVLEQASMTPEPDYEFVLGIKAEILCDIAEYEMAAQILNQLTSLNPYSDWFWTLKGWTLTKLGQERFQEARIAYENALKLNPKNLWRYKSVAEILYLLGNKKASNILYTKIIKKMQKQTDLLNFDLLGWSNYRLGHYSTAAKFFIQAISSPDKNSFTSQFDLSLALMRSKRYELGLQEYKKGLDMISNLSTLRHCGLLSIAIIDLEDALSDQRDFNFQQIPEVQEAQSLLNKAFEKAKEESSSYRNILISINI